MPEFKNTDLNGKYVINGVDNEIQITVPALAFKGPVSGCNEEQVKYLVGRNSPHVSLKAEAAKPKGTETKA